MSRRLADFTRSLRQLGEIRVNDWDLMGLMNTDLKDIEIGRSLRRLGNVKVIDWDFSTAMPAVHRLAHQEIHLVDWVRRATHHQDAEPARECRPAEGGGTSSDGELAPAPEPEATKEIVARLKAFLEFVIACLVDEPASAQVEVEEIERDVIRFRVTVSQKDVKELIGRGGATAASMRNLLKAKAAADGVHALLQVASHEELAAPGADR